MVTQTRALVDGFKPSYVLAGKGYDSPELIQAIEQQGAQAVIPPRNCERPRAPMTRLATACAVESSAALPSSNNGGVWPPATTASPPTSWQRSWLLQSGYGYSECRFSLVLAGEQDGFYRRACVERARHGQRH